MPISGSKDIAFIFVFVWLFALLYMFYFPSNLTFLTKMEGPVRTYLDKYGLGILMVVIVTLFLIVFFAINGVTFDTNGPKHLEKIITIEGFDNKEGNDKTGEKAFCDLHIGKSDKLEKECNKLSKTNCTSTTCCGWAEYCDGKESCVAGKKNGPTFKGNAKEKKIVKNYHFHGLTKTTDCPSSKTPEKNN